MNIYRNNQGYLIIEDLLGGEYKRMSYLYYTKQEAIKKFKQKYGKYYHKNGHKIK
tara:strand:- start:6 stop:170 length:165 start_codon:yes stop_codon:yes gene_type:complete